MPRKKEGFLDLLVVLPWWVSCCMAIVLYLGLRFVAPSIDFPQPVLKGMASSSPKFAWMAVFLVIPAAFSFIQSVGKRKLLDNQTGIDSIRSLSWKEFEELLGEAYRRQGYSVFENNLKGADGGIDLELRKSGSRYLVQAKQWKNRKVAVNVVREMLGLMTAERAHGAFIVSSGSFTQEALNFAKDKPIELVNGDQLCKLIENLQPKSRTPRQSPTEGDVIDNKDCPLCGGKLLLRMAKRGAHARSQFWGCSNYPKCNHTEAMQNA
jgi:restriction system protein